jgi:NAD(P)H-dependent flavin oxidoreductase YrpB (nitropropane dioxygenase family)
MRYPIVRAPMGLIATADFAAAVSNAGALGLVVVDLGSAEHPDAELAKMRRLTDQPFGGKCGARLPYRSRRRRGDR